MRKNIVVAVTIALLGVISLYAVKTGDRTPTTSAATTQLLAGKLRDGKFKGDRAETPYGPVQIEVEIKNGRITDVKYLDMPDDDARSSEITGFASPALRQNTIKAQSANIDFVSGATSTSYGYQQSLQAALDKAKGSPVRYQQPT